MLQNSHCKTQEQIYVVKELQKALLGRHAIESLGLLIRVNAVLSSKLAVVSKFLQLFTSLGCMEGAYHIDLQSDTKTFALTAPQRIAIPLMDKVKTELQQMEKIGVICHISELTDWCAGLVVVFKPDG